MRTRSTAKLNELDAQAPAAVPARTEDEPSARERVLESEELLGEIFAALALKDRVGALTNGGYNWDERAGAWSSVNRRFLTVFRSPEHWRAISLFDAEATYDFCTCFPRDGVTSLLIRNSDHRNNPLACANDAAEHPAFVLALRGPWPSLTELDLSHSVLPLDGLLAALRPLGVCMAQRSFAEVLKVYDSDGSVSIGVEEFAALVRKEAAFAAARKECNTCPTADQTRNLHSPASCA